MAAGHKADGAQPSACPFGEQRQRCIRQLTLGRRAALVIDLPDEVLPIPEVLTASEREILRHVIQGLSTETIAGLRKRSYRTVANQLAAIYRKVGVASRAELVARLGGQYEP